jgi:hypothetical protein
MYEVRLALDATGSLLLMLAALELSDNAVWYAPHLGFLLLPADVRLVIRWAGMVSFAWAMLRLWREAGSAPALDGGGEHG